ncbi:hypothetical protein VMCG_04015 [Cytospora schulzeri]|uniref:Mid2 domain-containing protein n=1 Tax=Cytospora schulzeri TaxID=448051 RepID=A0A423WTI7_9PEZI|nr:hypothetical protein VMCG_04015 [Valsa malicola]
MLGMGTLRRICIAATVIDRPPRAASAFISRFRLCLLASLVLISVPFTAASDTGATFIYPTGGESFYTLDYVIVTYQSTFASPSLYTFCSINGVTQQMHVQDAEPNTGSVLVHLNVTTNTPCWFELSPEENAGESVTSEKWTVLARTRDQSTWSATATATSTTASTPVTMASVASDKATDQTPQPESHTGLSSGAKIGIALAVAFGIVVMSTIAFWFWWRRRQRREVAKDMVNFVDGDIVNLMDGGRFEKRMKPPNDYYDPYLGASSQSTISPSTYPATSNYHPAPPAEQQQQYYAPAPVQHQTAPPIQPVTVPPPPAVTNEHAAWAGPARHPWSPPDYEGHSSSSDWSVQPESDFFHAIPHQSHSSPSRDMQASHPVEALPAILPEMKPQAELPAREGFHGHGYEQELPAPHQAPPKGRGLVAQGQQDERPTNETGINAFMIKQSTGLAGESRNWPRYGRPPALGSSGHERPARAELSVQDLLRLEIPHVRQRTHGEESHAGSDSSIPAPTITAWCKGLPRKRISHARAQDNQKAALDQEAPNERQH